MRMENEGQINSHHIETYLPSKEIQVYIKMFSAIDILSFNKVTLCYVYWPVNMEDEDERDFMDL